MHSNSNLNSSKNYSKIWKNLIYRKILNIIVRGQPKLIKEQALDNFIELRNNLKVRFYTSKIFGIKLRLLKKHANLIIIIDY